MSYSSKVRLALATIAIGGATLAATTAVTSTSAEARRFVVRGGFVHTHRFVYLKPRYIVPLATVATVAVVANSCAAYRWRAQAYNSPYWWERYKDCKGY